MSSVQNYSTNWKGSELKRNQAEYILAISDVDAGSGARRIVPSPLSHPITDQELYNPVGPAYIDEARRAAI
ncbi:hypothetical protein KIN20_030588 [Parelaphostrongylus tenuis]|uniref:Uncharacterized protein n=1 Tax=Parelaphostrongylus tenuis TaxID=148309 RepID=A0AAD5R4C3_PARTN|nr:hypothetical protein KIN20_030588 [Parelaphostrongylus tenuis]